MTSYTKAEILLQTYSLEEILEHNDLTEEDVLNLLIENELVDTDPAPLDFNYG